MTVLFVDDDRELLDLMRFALKRAGLEAVLAFDAAGALRSFAEKRPAIAVLDVNLGADNGFDLLLELRRASDLPIIMLTARASEEDKIRGLELGADDYVTKPFSPRELVARVRAQLRRSGTEVGEERPAAPLIEVGPLRLSVAEHTVTRDGKPIELTVTEFRLLHALMQQAGSVVSTAALLRQVWGYEDPTARDVVRVAVHRLRRKLGDDAADPRLLHTIAGVGVMLRPEA
jgi:two-component system response regulator VicR